MGETRILYQVHVHLPPQSDYYHDPGYGGGGYGDLQTGHTRGGAGHAMVVCMALLSAVGVYLYMFYQREPYVDPYHPNYQVRVQFVKRMISRD